MEASGRVVVVTGGGSGIGAALCRAFAAGGARAVVVADVNGDAAAAVGVEVGGDAVSTDVTREADVVELVRRTVDAHGRIDIYCSNAGIAVGGGMEAADEDWQRSWNVHVMAHVYAARAVIPAMVDRGEGCFLGTASAAALLNHIASAPYAATKAATLSVLEWLAITYGPRGVQVAALCPQGVKTPMLAAAGERDFLADGALEPQAVAGAVLEGLRDERFLILPHPEVREYFARKASDYDRWLRGMQRLRDHVLPG
ncbi:MAG: SDR family oxidoreductase [Candidatus Dormibacteraeota bacterium]|uniref:SDR family oxidoreductase n=1 Tax=Candidatus Aeolococcus gillhamiae TaxID=3127015 RepID=A0A2W6ATZ9_9BACT|nr:SDR family oxidoreductase [Candidatus Dormibacteraeota bacterium]PZR81341.1 MAG: short-chain dehydrogenase [Candidatus Dormibacter sp. RRmetagenome_bin12]